MPRKAERRQFGQISKLPSGRFRARYADPDGRMTADGEVLRHSAPHTFDTKGDAEAWLADERRLIVADTWKAPSVAHHPDASRAPLRQDSGRQVGGTGGLLASLRGESGVARLSLCAAGDVPLGLAVPDEEDGLGHGDT